MWTEDSEHLLKLVTSGYFFSDVAHNSSMLSSPNLLLLHFQPYAGGGLVPKPPAYGRLGFPRAILPLRFSFPVFLSRENGSKIFFWIFLPLL